MMHPKLLKCCFRRHDEARLREDMRRREEIRIQEDILRRQQDELFRRQQLEVEMLQLLAFQKQASFVTSLYMSFRFSFLLLVNKFI